jgi:hypothetical protein
MGILSRVQGPQQPDQPETPTDQPDQQMPGDVPGQEPAQAAPGQGPNLQDAYSKVVLAGIKILHDQQTSGQIVQMLQQEADTPDKALSDVVVLIMSQIKEKSGGKVPQEVVLKAAGEILGETAKLAESSGAFQPSPDDIKSASQLMIAGVAKAYGATQQDTQQFMQSVDMNKIRQAVAKPQGQPQQQAPQQPVGA